MDERLEFHDIVNLLKKRAGMIILIVLGAVVAAGVISYYVMTPVYQTSAQILISQEIREEPGLTESDIQANLQLVSTYRELIESPPIMTEVIEQLDLNTTVAELEEQFTVISNSDSQLIDIAVTDESPSQAVNIANAAIAAFQEEVQGVLDVDNVKVWSPATAIAGQNPVSPNPLMNMAIGAALGLILGIGLAFLLSYLDTSIKNERDVEKYLGVPVLAVVSPVKGNLQDGEVEGSLPEKGG